MGKRCSCPEMPRVVQGLVRVFVATKILRLFAVPQQSREPGLFKMLVMREGRGHIPGLHDLK